MNVNAFKIQTLDAWLDYIESLHQDEIEFGLDRIRCVFNHLFPRGLTSKVITVGGTNGKGTTCSYIENILLSAGYSCGKNTSPHIIDFNERIAVNGQLCSDGDIVDAFQCVEESRQLLETKLTYFEFTFLAAIVIFEKEDVDFAICEVGMGGRLDAVNILSPEVSVITTIDIDHIEWLGDTREKVAIEKIAISRPNKPCVIGELNFPELAKSYISEHGVNAHFHGIDFMLDMNAKDSWSLKVINGKSEYTTIGKLPLLGAPHLYQNAACAIMAVTLLKNVDFNFISEGLQSSVVSGRCQVLSKKPLIILDVAHNAESIKALAAYLETYEIIGKVVAVCSMLQDKEINKSLAVVAEVVDEWNIAPLNTPRAASLVSINEAITNNSADAVVNQYDSIDAAFQGAKKRLLDEDCLVVFGSFFVVGDILRAH